MNQKNNVVGWFEIPVIDLQRAIKFYEAVFGYSIQHQPIGDMDMGWFPWSEHGIGSPGCLIKHKDSKPSAEGTLVYFTSPSGDLANELAKVDEAGGKVLQDKTLITEDIGYMGIFLDTEGNKIAIHSRQ